MDADFPLAVLAGLLIGLGTYWILAPGWYVAAVTATVYAGATYFYIAFDTSLLGRAVEFEDRTDRLGYAIGLFGLSVSPLALSQYYGTRTETTAPFVVVFFGVIAFLHLSSKAHQQREHAL